VLTINKQSNFADLGLVLTLERDTTIFGVVFILHRESDPDLMFTYERAKSVADDA
jgi:hypothetical protein